MPLLSGEKSISELDLWVSATLPIAGTRRRMQLVEAWSTLQPTAAGFRITAYSHRRSHKICTISIPADTMEQVVPGQVYYGRLPNPGLWLLFRDTEGEHRRLCLSFLNRARRRKALALLGEQQHAGEEQI